MSSPESGMENFVVIGKGLAGLSAALRATELGANVTLVVSRDGASALSSGAFDICRDPLGQPGDMWRWEKNWQKNIQTVVALNPYHPYRFSSSSMVRDSILGFIRALESIGFIIKISAENNMLLPTPVGTWKESAGAQTTQIGLDLFNNTNEHIVILRIKDHKNYLPEIIKERIQDYFFRKTESISRVSVVEIDLGLPMNLPDLAIAEIIEQGINFEKLLDILTRVVSDNEPSLLLFPPVLGLDGFVGIVERLSKELKTPVVETLGYYESVPGIRLQRAIERLLDRRGVRVIRGEVAGFSSKNSIIESLLIKYDKGEVRLDTGEVVLASGKWIGGGIRHLNAMPIKERVFDLPLSVDGERVDDTPPWGLFSHSYQDRHGAMRVGVRVNSILQPIGYRGEVLYDNLRAAGSVLTGYDPHADGCGSGVAVATGYLASEFGLKQ